jgi:hypothetical protein
MDNSYNEEEDANVVRVVEDLIVRATCPKGQPNHNCQHQPSGLRQHNGEVVKVDLLRKGERGGGKGMD